MSTTLVALSSIPLEPEPAHLVGTGGALGALARYWVYLEVSWEDLPAATLVVNVVGSFLLGVLVFAGVDESTLQLLGVGFCGSVTTFSSFSVETVQLWERGDRTVAIVNAGVNLLASLVAIGLAWLILAV
ncbi:fluoride efflux transporter CrcB [Natrialbaceae archaeon A-gly3]